MTDVRSATADLLEERPEFKDDLRPLLDIDDGDPWEFDDIPLDSGTFGELVSRGIVESVGDGYRLADTDAVEAAMDGEPQPRENTASETGLSVLSRIQNIDPVFTGLFLVIRVSWL